MATPWPLPGSVHSLTPTGLTCPPVLCAPILTAVCKESWLMVVPLFNIWKKWSGFCFKHEEEFMVCCWLADCYIQVELLNQCWSPKKLRGWCQPQDFNGSMHQMRGRMYIYIAILILINIIEVSYQVSVIEEDIFIYIIFFSNWSPSSKRNLLACTCVLNEECFLMGRSYICKVYPTPPHTHKNFCAQGDGWGVL